MADLKRYVVIGIFGKCAGYTCNKRNRSCVYLKNLITKKILDTSSVRHCAVCSGKCRL